MFHCIPLTHQQKRSSFSHQQLRGARAVLRPLLQARRDEVAKLGRELVGGEHRGRVMYNKREQVPEAEIGRLRVGEAAERALHDAEPHAPDVGVDAVLSALDPLRLQSGTECRLFVQCVRFLFAIAAHDDGQQFHISYSNLFLSF